MISVPLDSETETRLNLEFVPEIKDLDFRDVIKVTINHKNINLSVGETNILEFVVDSERLIDELFKHKLEAEPEFLKKSLSYSFQLERDKVYSEQIEIGDSNLEDLTRFLFLSRETNLFFYNLGSKKYLEVSPTYPWNYFPEDNKREGFITFSNWILNFKPYFNIEISEEVLLTWKKLCQDLRLQVSYLGSAR